VKAWQAGMVACGPALPVRAKAQHYFAAWQRWEQTLALMEQSLRIDERLAATDPTNVTWQNDVKVSRRLVAELRAKVAK